MRNLPPGIAVRYFHETTNQPYPTKPKLIDDERMLFRSALIDEEMDELAEREAKVTA